MDVADGYQQLIMMHHKVRCNDVYKLAYWLHTRFLPHTTSPV